MSAGKHVCVAMSVLVLWAFGIVPSVSPEPRSGKVPAKPAAQAGAVVEGERVDSADPAGIVPPGDEPTAGPADLQGPSVPSDSSLLPAADGVQDIQPVPEAVQPGPSGEEVRAPAGEGSWSDTTLPLLRTVGGAGLVISLILAGFFGFRRFAPQYMNRRPAEKVLRLIETLPMGEKRNIALIQVGGRRYLVGNAPGGISILAALRDAAVKGSTPAEEASAEEAEAATYQVSSFRKLYELERKTQQPRFSGPATIPPDIRGKMRELREALEG